MSERVLKSLQTLDEVRVAHQTRRLFGWAITMAGTLLLLNRFAASLAVAAVAEALQGGLVAALATAGGAFPILMAKRISERSTDALLGFGAGVMLAATAFSLLLPALAAATGLGLEKWGAAGITASGVALGALALLAADRVLPHQHAPTEGASGATTLGRVALFVAAITLHNIPEGLAIGVAFAQEGGGATVAGGIALQDIPEGLVVAAALAGAGVGRVPAFLVAAATGLAEPVAAVMGATLVVDLPALLPWALAFAAGAMLFVISHEIIPESHRRGHESLATGGLIAGFCLMMVLDTALA
ncbi:MAG: ZIP family metal transporter [Zoogloeaceae bacterium]|nr:ZIP family metal transporter [Zoogloeaceae bacterium]